MPAPLIALAILASAPALPPPSADDCAIVVAFGKKAFRWGQADAAAFDLDPELGQDTAPPEAHWDNRAVDLTRCAWTQLDAPALAPATAASRNRFWVRGPTYDQSGGASATLVVLQSGAGPEGRAFFEALNCRFAKTAGAWTLTGCRLAGIS